MKKYLLFTLSALLTCFCMASAEPDYAAGDVITIGTYEQDGNLSNGAEPIEWQVLGKNSDNSYVLMSQYAIDAMEYNVENVEVTWETCTLRQWLNGEFYQTAFTDDERGLIQLTTLENADNPVYGYYTEGGNDTQDYVYLLSLDDVEKYYWTKLEGFVSNFGKCEDLICVATQYALDNGAVAVTQEQIDQYMEEYRFRREYDYPLHANATCWWLRSPGSGSCRAAYIDMAGQVQLTGYHVDNIGFEPDLGADLCIRPVIVVNYSGSEVSPSGQ